MSDVKQLKNKKHHLIWGEDLRIVVDYSQENGGHTTFYDKDCLGKHDGICSDDYQVITDKKIEKDLKEKDPELLEKAEFVSPEKIKPEKDKINGKY